jgi:hypothetical protein
MPGPGRATSALGRSSRAPGRPGGPTAPGPKCWSLLEMLRQDQLFVSSVQSHLMALRTLLYKDKDIRILSDEDVRRRLEFVNFDAIIPRKVFRCKSYGAVQARASEGQFDSLTKTFQNPANGNGKLPLLPSKSGIRLLHLAYVGNTPSKSVKRRETVCNSTNSLLIPDSTKDSFEVSKSARSLMTSVLDEVLQMSVDEAVGLDNNLDFKALIGSDDYAEVSDSARDWMDNLINDVMQSSLMNSGLVDCAIHPENGSESVHGESSLCNGSVQLSSYECDQEMTGSARGTIIGLVHDTLCFCVEDTQNYLDVFEPLDNGEDQLPPITDDKRDVQVFRGPSSEEPSDSRQALSYSRKAFLNSVQDNLDSLRSILYGEKRLGAHNKDTKYTAVNCPIVHLDQANGTIIRQNLLLQGKKESNVLAGKRTFPGLKSGNTGVQIYKQSSVPASRMKHYRPSNLLLTQRPCRAATVDAATVHSRGHNSHHAAQISQANAPVGPLPKVAASDDNRKWLQHNSRDKKTFFSGSATVCTSLPRSRSVTVECKRSYDERSKASVQSDDIGSKFNLERHLAVNPSRFKTCERDVRETKAMAVKSACRNGERRTSTSPALPLLPAL